MEELQRLRFNSLQEASNYRSLNYDYDSMSGHYITMVKEHQSLIKNAVIFVPQDQEANRLFWNNVEKELANYTDNLYQKFSESEKCEINFYNIR